MALTSHRKFTIKTLERISSTLEERRQSDWLAQLVSWVWHRTAVWEVAGSNLDQTNNQGLKITEEKVLPL